METKTMVAYASKYGATAEIAERIGQVLREAGLETDVLPVDRVGDLTPYRAVVLGSAVYIGGWRKSAATFLKAKERELSSRSVWLFSSGPTGGGPAAFMDDGRLPKGLRPVADRIRPRDIAVFGGTANRERLNAFERWIMNRVKAPLGEFRDWKAIASWATAIAEELKDQNRPKKDS
ncbi:MAG TPA: flavodoxin domain-containing protein [Bacillota bacterium]